MDIRPGEVVRGIAFQKSAGFLDGEFAKVDHVHDIEPETLNLLTSSTDTNLIDNPEFRLSQRTLPITGVNQFGFDRWIINVNGAAVLSHAVATNLPTGAQTGAIYTVTTVDATIAAAEYTFLSQGVEGYVAAPALFGSSSAKNLTLSFWAKASLAGTYCVALRNSAANRSYVKEYTLTAATWTKITLTIPGCTDGTWETYTNAGFFLTWALSSGTTFQTLPDAWTTGNFLATSNQVNLTATLSNYFSLTQVQLTIGNIEPPFKSKNHIDDLTKCKRYFQLYTDPPLRGVVAAATTANRMGMVFPVEFRGTPTVSYTGTPNIYDGTTANPVTSIAANYLNSRSAEHDLNVGAGGLTVGRAAVLYRNSGSSTWYYSAEI
jgi:hypothetical protein